MNNGLKLYSILLLFATFFLLKACDDGPTEPEIEPGRRDYIWKIDTLAQDSFSRVSTHAIWGESPDNIWVGGSASTYKNTLWHYDGEKWERHLLDKAISIHGFYGIDRNNIWAASSNFIWHYNGSGWYEFTKIELPGYDEVSLNAIDGFSNNEIYAVGLGENLSNGQRTQVCMKYDGSKWDFVNIPMWDALLPDVKVDKNQGYIFIDAERLDLPENRSFHYLLQGSDLIEILNSSNYMSLGKMGNKIYHVNSKKIYRYINGNLNLAVDLEGTNYAGRIWGRSEKDFFGVTWGFTIAHYNGTDLKDIFQLSPDYYVTDALVFDNEIFFIYENSVTGISYILHGILK